MRVPIAQSWLGIESCGAMASGFSSPAKAFQVDEAYAVVEGYYACLCCSNDWQYDRIGEGFNE